MIQYTDYFRLSGGDSGGGQGIVTAMLFSIFPFGTMAGSFLAGPISDKWGRRIGMFVSSLIILTGVSLVTAAQSRTYLFFGRFIIGFGTTINYSAAPAYVAEMSPPQWRGRLSGLCNTTAFLGSTICYGTNTAGLVVATGRINSSAAWRLPFALQFIPTVILGLGVCFIPEVKIIIYILLALIIHVLVPAMADVGRPEGRGAECTRQISWRRRCKRPPLSFWNCENWRHPSRQMRPTGNGGTILSCSTRAPRDTERSW
ncbi:hypothetical protein C8J57DRAFT_754922 [Mycena rebaudengoi]|nr:hypothetical protein C8J57DRAFT_754922 [Mycena rebaudengoi]